MYISENIGVKIADKMILLIFNWLCLFLYEVSNQVLN